jgi:hypothetical protein
VGDGGEQGVWWGTICEVDDLHLRTYLTSTMSLWRLLDEHWPLEARSGQFKLPSRSGSLMNMNYPLGQGNRTPLGHHPPGFLCSLFYGRACHWAVLGEIKT